MRAAVNIRPLVPAAMMIGSTMLAMLRMVLLLERLCLGGAASSSLPKHAYGFHYAMLQVRSGE